VLNVSLFTVEALDQAEDYLICTGVTDQDEILDEEVVQRLFLYQQELSPNLRLVD
jgi:hypothetical protein